jgi:hypothetical protein
VLFTALRPEFGGRVTLPQPLPLRSEFELSGD